MKKIHLSLVLILALYGVSFSQETFPPVVVSQGEFLGETMPLRDFPKVQEWDEVPENIYEVQQNFRVTGRRSNLNTPQGPDPIIQEEGLIRNRMSILQNFDGINLNQGQAIPPDPTGAVGPNHYVHAVNLAVEIYDKQGTSLAGPVSLNAFLGVGGAGDPIVMYDQLADRYFVSQFRTPPIERLIIGISTTNDPTGSYYVYQYDFTSFPDYPHYSVWPSSYIVAANKTGQTTYAFERDVMLAGGDDPRIVGFSLPQGIRNPNTVFGPLPANLLGTRIEPNVPGYMIYLQDDDWTAAITEDHIKIWQLTLDWGNDDFSISAPQVIVTTPFNSEFQPFGTGNVNQPGTGNRIDNINGVISYMANYRAFDTHNSLLINFNVDIDGNDTSGIRWMELRNTGTGPFSIFQESTYTLPGGLSAFMGSMSMDEEGNIGLAYNTGSSAERVGVRYTGRFASDPLNQMTLAETSIVESDGIQTNTNRFGDYAQMTIDIDNRTFWHTTEYLPSNNFWTSRIASFKLIDDKTDDVGVYNFVTPGFTGPYTSSETVEVSLYNFGTDPQSNFDIELLVDGSLVATETFTGTIAPSSSATYTFTQTIDISNDGQIYNVEARTILTGDEFVGNDNYNRDFSFTLLSNNDKIFGNSDLLIYPKDDKIYEILFKAPSTFGDMSFKVFNILGQEVLTGDMQAVNNGYRASANMSPFQTGVYIFEVTDNKNAVSKKLLVR